MDAVAGEEEVAGSTVDRVGDGRLRDGPHAFNVLRATPIHMREDLIDTLTLGPLVRPTLRYAS